VRPELFRVFEVGFPAYFVMLLSGFLFATTTGALWARRIGKDPDVIVDLGLACLLMGVVGGRILHVLADGYFWDYVHLCTDPSKVDWHIEQAECATRVYGPVDSLVNMARGLGFRLSEAPSHPKGVWDSAANVCHPYQADCFAWSYFWAGGLTYYGGFIGASLMAVYVLRRDRFPFWKAADMAGFAVPLGLGFGRMGCLLAGCCYGVESQSALALSFPPRSPASEAEFKANVLPTIQDWSHRVLPTQIFESAACLAIAAYCLLRVHGHKRYDGQVFVNFLGLYALARFLLEFIRDDDRGGMWKLSTSQLIGLALIGVALAIHARRGRGNRGGHDAQPPGPARNGAEPAGSSA
jgi:phosphatidylglycerol:prolipoprotein diacylglycerol transferase